MILLYVCMLVYTNLCIRIHIYTYIHTMCTTYLCEGCLPRYMKAPAPHAQAGTHTFINLYIHTNISCMCTYICQDCLRRCAQARAQCAYAGSNTFIHTYIHVKIYRSIHISVYIYRYIYLYVYFCMQARVPHVHAGSTT